MKNASIWKLAPLAALMMACNAQAVGLGGIQVSSGLNQPLTAEISLMGGNSTELSRADLLVGLASAEDFAKAGVERDFLLNSLRFRVETEGGVAPRVVVTSAYPIKEPYLNFLVEVQWPTGRILREYTVLLDIPGEKSVNERDTGPIATKHQQASGSPVIGTDGPTYGPVGMGDTLWQLSAGATRPAGMSQKALMEAVVASNPDAFVGGDKDKMRAGVVLLIPHGVSFSSKQSRGASTTKTVEQKPILVVEPKAVEPIKQETMAPVVTVASPDVNNNEDAVLAGLRADRAAQQAEIEANLKEVALGREKLAAAEKTIAELDGRLVAMSVETAALRAKIEAAADPAVPESEAVLAVEAKAQESILAAEARAREIEAAAVKQAQAAAVELAKRTEEHNKEVAKLAAAASEAQAKQSEFPWAWVSAGILAGIAGFFGGGWIRREKNRANLIGEARSNDAKDRIEFNDNHGEQQVTEADELENLAIRGEEGLGDDSQDDGEFGEQLAAPVDEDVALELELGLDFDLPERDESGCILESPIVLGDANEVDDGDCDGVAEPEEDSAVDIKDEMATRLSLAEAYIDMNAVDAAMDLLQEIIDSGDGAHVDAAKELMERII